MTGQMNLEAETNICKICDEEAAESCQGGLCDDCCESNRGTGPFQCCDGQGIYDWSSDESAEAFVVGHGGTKGAQSREATALLRANGMAERKQRGDGNCMFRSLSEAAVKRPEYHKELRRRVVRKMRAGADEEGADSVSELGAWGTSEALKVAAGEMQVRVNVITMDGAPDRPVEVQTVGGYGPVISVALYAQHMDALVKEEVKLRCSGRDVRAVRNNGMLMVTGWRASEQKKKAKMGRKKAEWRHELKQTEHRVPMDKLSTSAAAVTGAAAATVCMMAVAATAAGRTVKQKWDWGTVMAILVTIAMATVMVAIVSATTIWRCNGIWDAASTGVGATGMYTVGTGGWNSTGGREVKSALAFVGHIGDKPVVTGMDTYCETSAIRRSLVDPKWEVLDAGNMQIKGVGSELLGPRVSVPYRHRFNMQAGSLGARIMDDEMMPDGVDVMMGTVEQLEQAAKFDAGNERLELWALGAAIMMGEAEVLRASKYCAVCCCCLRSTVCEFRLFI